VPDKFGDDWGRLRLLKKWYDAAEGRLVHGKLLRIMPRDKALTRHEKRNTGEGACTSTPRSNATGSGLAAPLVPTLPGVPVPPATSVEPYAEKHWRFNEAATHLAISKSTLRRLTLIELAEGAVDICHLRIGPKQAHTLYTYSDSALRRIYNRMVGGYYNRPRG
jgi:hypothetical protein